MFPPRVPFKLFDETYSRHHFQSAPDVGLTKSSVETKRVDELQAEAINVSFQLIDRSLFNGVNHIR